MSSNFDNLKGFNKTRYKNFILNSFRNIGIRYIGGIYIARLTNMELEKQFSIHFKECPLEMFNGKSEAVRRYVYILMTENGNQIKVGSSKAIGDRYKALIVGNHRELNLYKFFIGSFSEERELHEILKPFKIRSERFLCNNQVLKIIDNHINKIAAC